jgi:hypothetical protein
MPLRRGPKLTAADMVMAVSQEGRENDVPEMDTIQSMLWNLAGEPSDITSERDVDSLRGLITAPLKDHEASVAWVVSELVRVAELKRDFTGLRDAITLAVKLGFKLEAYMRAISLTNPRGSMRGRGLLIQSSDRFASVTSASAQTAGRPSRNMQAVSRRRPETLPATGRV